MKADDIWFMDKARSFVGYSPVLQTIGNFLVGQNYVEVQNTFETADNGSGLKVISDFIDALLRREQKKVTDILKKGTKYPPDFEGWDAVYSPEIQMKCIIIYLTNNYDITSIITLIEAPVWLENAYIDAISQFLPNHPFIRKGDFASASFKDYSLAYLLSSDSFETEALQYIRKYDSNLSPLFTNYYFRMNDGVCPGIYAGFIYDSVSSKLKLGSSQLLTVSKGNGNGYTLTISFEDRDGNFDSISFSCFISDEIPLTFEKRLHNALVLIDSAIRLGGFGKSIELKDVEISCSHINIEASEVIANCYDNSSVSIVAETFAHTSPLIKVKKIGSDNFFVNFPESNRYPWSEFHNSDLAKFDFQGKTLTEKIYALKLILTPFRKHSKGVFGKQHEYIENIIVKDNPVRREVFNKLISQRVLIKSSGAPIYELNDAKIQEFGINWGDLKSLSLNEKLVLFLN